MTDEKLLSLLLTALMIVGTVPTLGLASATAAAGNTAGNTTTFHVEQGSQCYEVQALGDGTKSVESFYDYRPNEEFSSHGTGHLQDNQESKLFFYNGTNGYSLVFLHDEYAENDSDAPYGSTITFNFSGMPSDGSWAVQDDSYGSDTDDQWDTKGSEQGVNWMWSEGRNDGGAFLGIKGAEITITPKFNEDAQAWGDWPYSGDQNNRVSDWKLIDSDKSEQTLDMNQNITVATGSCSDSGGEDTTAPSAALSASPNPAANNEEVTLDASASTDDGGSGISEYVWDFDGDGKTDATTSSATTTTTYTATGSYNASVTVVDGNGNRDVANTTVEVKESTSGGPVVSISHPNTVNVGETFEVWANSTNNSKVEGYEWHFGSTTKTGKKVTHSYAKAGKQKVTVKWTESDGDSKSKTFTIEVVEDSKDSDSAPPEAALSVPDEIGESETLALDARGSSDDVNVTQFKYYVNGVLLWQENNYTTAHPWQTEQFPDGPGTYEVSVKVWDEDGQTDSVTKTVTINPDNTDPSGEIAVSGTKKVGEKVTFTAKVHEELDLHQSVCWEFGGEQPGCLVANGKTHSGWKTWTTSFETSGKKTVKLLLEDHAGNTHTVTKTIDIAAKSSDGGGNNGGNNNPGEGGFTGGDNTDTRSGNIGTADPGQNADDQQSPETVSAPLMNSDGQFGSVVVRADSAGNANVVVSQTAPEGVEAPSVAANGFEALSFLNVSGAQQVTVSISKAQLNATGASPEEVSLFRYENGSWTAVETTVLNATNKSYRFRASASDGVLAVGIERAATGVTDLSVSNQRVEVGEQVTITAMVENTGRADGEHEVTLSVGSEEVATKTVSVAAGETIEVTFDRTFDSGGTYEISVGDANAQVVVKSVETQTSTTDEGSSDDSEVNDETTTDDNNNGSGIPGFGVGVSLVALLAAALIALRRQ